MAPDASRASGAAADGLAPDPGLTDTSASPHAVVRSVGLGEVTMDPGVLGRPVRDLPEAMVPHLWGVMSGTEPSQFYPQLRGSPRAWSRGATGGPRWNDGDFYKWIEAAVGDLRVTKDDDLDRRMDEVIGVDRPAQRRRRLPAHARPDPRPQRRSRRGSRSRTASTSRPTTSAT